VARNRKRAKERRSRRPQSAVARQGVATTRADRDNETPGPIRHAAPDVELAEAQMALGRPDLADADPELAEAEPVFPDAAEPEALDEDQFETLEDEVDEEALEEDHGGPPRGGPPRDGPPLDGGGELAVPAGAVPERRARPGKRLINFLRGSWRELQRVQWPDRRQVVQATGVVIGFVIVAGVFLGVADLLATKLMNFILK
jgi:preprotein translocase subunit SecE